MKQAEVMNGCEDEKQKITKFNEPIRKQKISFPFLVGFSQVLPSVYALLLAETLGLNMSEYNEALGVVSTCSFGNCLPPDPKIPLLSRTYCRTGISPYNFQMAVPSAPCVSHPDSALQISNRLNQNLKR